jgi:hypothetical protein
MNTINKKYFDSIETDTGMKIPYNMALWPMGTDGKPIRKSDCLWTGSAVVPKTKQQLDSDSAKKELPETEKDMPSALEDLIDVLLANGVIKKSDVLKSTLDIYEKKKELRGKIL